MRRELAGMKVGSLLALLTIPAGFDPGAMFGLAEDSIKDGFLKTSKQTLAGSPYFGVPSDRSATGDLDAGLDIQVVGVARGPSSPCRKRVAGESPPLLAFRCQA